MPFLPECAQRERPVRHEAPVAIALAFILVAVLFGIAIVKSRIERFINRHGMSLMAFLEDHCRVPARYAVGDQRT